MYAIASSLNTKEPIMLLNQPIGFNSDDPGSAYIDGALFQQELLELDNAGYSSIKIYINCVGGNVIEGFGIVNAILKSKTPVDTYNVGIAASMGGYIFLTGRKRIMADYASLMIHNPYGGNDKKMIGAFTQSLLTIFKAKCNLSEQDAKYFMDRETWFTSSECFAKGLCTEIEVTSESNQKRMPLVSANAIWKEANLIQANLFKNDNNNIMDTPQVKTIGTSVIAAYLNLNTEATETSVLNEVKATIGKHVLALSESQDIVAKQKTDLAKMKADLDDMTSKYNAAMKDKAESDEKAKKEKDAAEAKAKKDTEEATAKIKAAQDIALRAEIKTEVDAAAKVGKIKSDKVEEWIETGILIGKEKVKAMIEALPLNKVAPGSVIASILKDPQGNEVADPEKVPANAMSYQARVQANANARYNGKTAVV